MTVSLAKDAPAAAWPAGFVVNPRQSHLSTELIEAYRSVPVPHASDCMGRHTGARGLIAYHGEQPATIAGPALTVRIRPGDNLMIHLAIMTAEPGDVIVIDGGGDLSTAVIGGLMRTSALARGIAAFVLDGALRDVAEWKEGGVGAFARGNVHRGPSKEGPGALNVPVACAGLSVMPGDLILADADGVVAVPAADAESLLAKCRAHAERERAINEKNRTGEPDWDRFNTLLRQKGCPV
ncbi:RraA family protein [Sinorhizobium medicae]|uniref:Putative 4-hydroxy-4-methyl-2-oxoglutarate aldolase n=1 Tax=Sinorhizobium medicae TaxID=110321 RepID=A0A508WV03_9HYPH|nr:RraA family protein [Sinorhizobium medicae]MBO1960485.1 RraA family protein [Sinorhizobium medicae]MDX0524482.1 RraA family protein [Sinorhizobium medicae]MDX0635882.1 RraA family protein [Sinorhizobium medicae]MDX0698295.1 RraA family protein [Sinorhizobium medicae]MDX0747956.1 RraA family protein [Sinorhizobium medicae]